MIVVHFDRDEAARILGAFNSGGSISPPPDGAWRGRDMLLLAGVAMAGALSQGPESFNARVLLAESELPPEHMEAHGASLPDDLVSGIQWIMERAFEVLDGEYDDRFESKHVGLVDANGTVVPVKGFKREEGD